MNYHATFEAMLKVNKTLAIPPFASQVQLVSPEQLPTQLFE